MHRSLQDHIMATFSQHSYQTLPLILHLPSMSAHAKLLVVLTSQDILPTREKTKTGWYLPELVHPYNILKSHVEMVFASPKGGEAPIDPYSIEDSKTDEACTRFLKENEAVWKDTKRLETMLDRIDEFVGIFFVGGHGRK